jgi:catechol 2,3-dioxygenase-like lactoylglutathione lyase family enzyme
MVHFFDIGTRPVLASTPGSIPGSTAAAAPVQAPNLAGIAHAAIRVADLDKSRDFYAKLGYEEAFNMSQGGKTTQSFVKINDRQFIELYPQRQPSDTIGFMHVCFESADIQALHDTYVARGLTPIAVRKAAAGNLLFTMEGPEKQNLEYTQYMPGSRHSNDKGLHLGANRVSEQIVAVGVEMQAPAAAAAFYKRQACICSWRSAGGGANLAWTSRLAEPGDRDCPTCAWAGVPIVLRRQRSSPGSGEAESAQHPR